MSAAKYFVLGGVFLFGTIGFMGYYKKPASEKSIIADDIQEISLPLSVPIKEVAKNEAKASPAPIAAVQQPSVPVELLDDLPDGDRIQQLFATDSSKLPIVETVSYTSRAPWIKGRPAWIADYASHYNTSRHFIARSLNRKPDYLSQQVSPGDRFNVFKKDKNLNFHFVVDLSRCRMWFYYLDLDQNERVLLKTYKVGVGRIDAKKKSGYLTPIGKYSFGDKIAIYKPGVIGFFQDQKMEMIRVFGTRWIPFEKEIEGCSEPARGLGLHGTPWIENAETHELLEDRNKIGKYESDGCLRLFSEDIEEIFSIVITKPTTIEIVKDFRDAKLPGVEKKGL